MSKSTVWDIRLKHVLQVRFRFDGVPLNGLVELLIHIDEEIQCKIT